MGLIAKLEDAQTKIEQWQVKPPERAFELAVAITEMTPDEFDEIEQSTDDHEKPEGKAIITVIADAADELIGSGES